MLLKQRKLAPSRSSQPQQHSKQQEQPPVNEDFAQYFMKQKDSMNDISERRIFFLHAQLYQLQQKQLYLSKILQQRNHSFQFIKNFIETQHEENQTQNIDKEGFKKEYLAICQQEKMIQKVERLEKNEKYIRRWIMRDYSDYIDFQPDLEIENENVKMLAYLEKRLTDFYQSLKSRKMTEDQIYKLLNDLQNIMILIPGQQSKFWNDFKSTPLSSLKEVLNELGSVQKSVKSKLTPIWKEVVMQFEQLKNENEQLKQQLEEVQQKSVSASSSISNSQLKKAEMEKEKYKVTLSTIKEKFKQLKSDFNADHCAEFLCQLETELSSIQ